MENITQAQFCRVENKICIKLAVDDGMLEMFLPGPTGIVYELIF